jgi:NAD(P)-dependent dehydrogenase (short-subunit alcohol dehydrogenase family)
MKLEGKVAIITGGGRGIGRAIALRFAREGARTVIAARSSEELQGVAQEIQKLNQGVLAVQVDISKEADVARMVSQTLKRFDTIDILVNNAGVNLPKRNVVDLTLKEWEQVLAINLTGTFLTTKAVLPVMMERRRGKIINISSRGGRLGAAGRGPYRASKAAIINLTETVAAEVRDYGIDVNAICPGNVDTAMMKQISVGRTADVGIQMNPDEIAKVALFLASDDSSAIRGAAIDAVGHTTSMFR